jgi:RNA polymerase II subunit A small phosphatase-like protein
MKDKLLILDIDECLIHSVHKTQVSEMSFDFYKNSFDVLGGMYRTMKRPHLDEFLDFAYGNFNVAVWTAAGADYASEVLEKIGININSLKFFYSEKNCTPKYEYGDGWGMGHMVYQKKISKLSKRGWDMEKVLMLDDKPEYIDSYGNVIKVDPFYGDTSDSELLKVMKYLDLIKNEENYRSVDKRNWKNRI